MSSLSNEPEGSQAFEGDASDYHAIASVADLLVAIRNENKTNKLKNDKQQYTHMEFVDKKTGEILTQRVIF